MNLKELAKMYDFSGRSIAVTGGAGILCGEIACTLAECGAGVAILVGRDIAKIGFAIIRHARHAAVRSGWKHITSFRSISRPIAS